MRAATLTELSTLLSDQHTRKVDVVAPATSLTAEGGLIRVRPKTPIISADGVLSDGLYRPTPIAIEGMGNALKIPTAYLKRVHEERPDIFDDNVNGWLRGRPDQFYDNEMKYVGEDPRSFLVRAFTAGGEDGLGIVRAFLSDRYKIVDNIDVMMAALEGIRESGIDVADLKIECDLTERRMYIKVTAPQVAAYGGALVENYRSPFGGGLGRDLPMVWAGLIISNSEVGQGARSIKPCLTLEVCKNGMTVTKDIVRAVHLGAQLEDGIVNWSDETQQHSLALMKSQTSDAVRTFLDVDYVTKALEVLNAKAEQEVASVKEVEVLVKPLNYSPAQQESILSMFVQGGQMSRAGVANAITAAAQTVEDADVARAMEEQAVGILT